MSGARVLSVAARLSKLRAMSAKEIAHRVRHKAAIELERRRHRANRLAVPDRLRRALVPSLRQRDDWRAAQAAGEYRGSADDRRDGFLHFSTAAQVRASAARHRAGDVRVRIRTRELHVGMTEGGQLVEVEHAIGFNEA